MGNPISNALYWSAGGLGIFAGIIGLATLFIDKKPYLWIIYCILMAVLALVTLAGAVSSGSQGSDIVRKEMYKLIGSYREGKSFDESRLKVDKYQRQFKCCGVSDYSDWQLVEFGRTTLKVPTSCCKPSINGTPADEFCGDLCLPDSPNLEISIYSEGCFHKMTAELDERINVLTATGALLCAVAIILFILSCYLVISKKA